jgi:hypothetical protein
LVLAANAEVSLEANPGTVDLAYLQGLRQLGFNRLSFGVQSALPANWPCWNGNMILRVIEAISPGAAGRVRQF